MIVLDHVTKRFGKVRAVDDLCAQIPAGQSVALWGSNGAGKTTLIRCLLGILRHRGRITVDGQSSRRRGKAVRRRIGYVPQELAFHDDMRLGSAVRFFGSLRGTDDDRAAELLERVRLVGHERKRVRDLSGGMKQRLALAIAMLADPPIVVLDEPTSNLDAAGRSDVVDALRTLKSAGKTILFASHRPDEVMRLADRVLVMEKGKLARDTTPEALWPTDAGVVTLRLHLAEGDEHEAADVLRRAGHMVNHNGHGLCVSVARDRKATPIGDLVRARVEVRDIELLEDVLTTEARP